MDFHTHYYTKDYISAVEGVDYLKIEGIKFVVSDAMYNIDKRIEEMVKCGVDVQVLSLGPPGVDVFPDKIAVSMARKYNDELSTIKARYRGRFVGLATLPLIDIEAALEEAERAIGSLNLDGLAIYSNVAGKPISSEDFWQLFGLAEKLNVPLFLHPTTPIAAESMRDYGLTLITGFLFDSSLAALRLVFSGVLERFRDLRLVLSHLGGVLPYIIKRIDIESSSIDRRLGGRVVLGKLSKEPSNYIKEMYMDTVSLHEPAIKCAYETVGARRLLLGSDYPYWPLRDAIESIKGLDIDEEEKELILGGNAASLLRI